MFYAGPRPVLPGSLLKLASLETLKVFKCRFPNAGSAPAPLLPTLKILDLSNVAVCEESLQAIMSHGTSGVSEAREHHRSGQDLPLVQELDTVVRYYGDFGDLKELIVKDASSIKEMVGISLLGGKAKAKIIFAPKMLGYLEISVRPLVLHELTPCLM